MRWVRARPTRRTLLLLTPWPTMLTTNILLIMDPRTRKSSKDGGRLSTGEVVRSCTLLVVFARFKIKYLDSRDDGLQVEK